MCYVPKPHPQEFRDDVVAVARRGDAPVKQIAKDFGISESCLRNWLRGVTGDVLDKIESREVWPLVNGILQEVVQCLDRQDFDPPA